jgi:type IV pilus assembly protein PilM
MARRLIGLDIGTNAVTVAEVRPGEPPRLDLFGQVALGREVMREGEVADDAAVTDAVARLRAEVGLKKAAVRLGLASPRVVVRQVEMPTMTRDELGSALQFQAAELIPIPLDDAVLDYAILGPANPGEGGEPRMHVLLAAVQEATVLRLVAAVEAGGLQVAAVDLVPLALIRALAGAARDRALVGAAVAGHEASDGAGGVALADRGSGGAEGIVSFGGGVTAIAVHELGVPRFVRVLGTGGRELTDAIASELDLPPETAEALKRQLGAAPGAEPRHEELIARARGSIERPLSVLLDEVRSSIDYYRNQSDSSPLARIVATGGAAQLPGLTDRLSALVGVPVEDARPRELVALGDIGFADEELPRLDPYLPAAVGLALGGAGVGTVINLLPRKQRSSGVAKRLQIPPKVLAAGAVVVVGLGGLTFLTQHSLSSAKAKSKATQEQVARATSELAALQPILDREAQISSLQTSVKGQLTTDVAWQTMVKRIAANLPAGVTLTSFSGQVTPPAPVALVPTPTASTDTSSGSSSTETTTTTVPVPAAPVLAGTITFAGSAKDYPTLATWIDAMGKVPEISDVYVTSAQEVGDTGSAKKVTFSAVAVVAPGAVSHRIQQYTKAGS